MTMIRYINKPKVCRTVGQLLEALRGIPLSTRVACTFDERVQVVLARDEHKRKRVVLIDPEPV